MPAAGRGFAPQVKGVDACVARRVCGRHRAAVREDAGHRAGRRARHGAAGGGRRRARRALGVCAASGRGSRWRRPACRSPRAVSRRGRTASSCASRAVCGCGIGPRFGRAPAIGPVAEGGLAPREDGVDVRVARHVCRRRGAAGREGAGHRGGRRGRLRSQEEGVDVRVARRVRVRHRAAIRDGAGQCAGRRGRLRAAGGGR